MLIVAVETGSWSTRQPTSAGICSNRCWVNSTVMRSIQPPVRASTQRADGQLRHHRQRLVLHLEDGLDEADHDAHHEGDEQQRAGQLRGQQQRLAGDVRGRRSRSRGAPPSGTSGRGRRRPGTSRRPATNSSSLNGRETRTAAASSCPWRHQRALTTRSMTRNGMKITKPMRKAARSSEMHEGRHERRGRDVFAALRRRLARQLDEQLRGPSRGPA